MPDVPKPTRAKDPVPAWVIRERKRLGLKPQDLADRLTAMGLPVVVGTVRTWEAGRNPHPDNVEGLERIFGTRSPDYMAGAGPLGGDTPVPAAYLERIDALVGELQADRALIRELVAELRAARAEAEGYAAAVRELGSRGRAAPEDGHAGGPPADARSV